MRDIKIFINVAFLLLSKKNILLNFHVIIIKKFVINVRSF